MVAYVDIMSVSLVDDVAFGVILLRFLQFKDTKCNVIYQRKKNKITFADGNSHNRRQSLQKNHISFWLYCVPCSRKVATLSSISSSATERSVASQTILFLRKKSSTAYEVRRNNAIRLKTHLNQLSAPTGWKSRPNARRYGPALLCRSPRACVCFLGNR